MENHSNAINGQFLDVVAYDYVVCDLETCLHQQFGDETTRDVVADAGGHAIAGCDDRSDWRHVRL